MSEEINKALVRRFYYEIWNKGNMDVADELFDLNYIRHDLRSGNSPAGPEGQKKIAADFRNAFPDLCLTVSFIVAEKDMVVARWIMNGTHKGLWGRIEPTGKKAEFSGVNIFKFANNKVVELWNYRDDLSLMQQLGVPIHAGSKD